MPSFHDPARARKADRPCWAGQNTVLPALYITPRAEPRSDELVWFEIEIIVDGVWEKTTVSQKELEQLLLDWNNNPEEALKDWWGREAPKGPSNQAKIDSDESEPLTSNATAEELGL